MKHIDLKLIKLGRTNMLYITIVSLIGCLSLMNTEYLSLSNDFFKKKANILFIIISIFITIICSIRYGGGTDYFAYRWHFYDTPTNIIDAINYNSHMDIGFRVIISIFRMLGFKYEFFISVLSIFILMCYIYIINKYSKNKVLSLFLLISGYYLVYVESALRQGLAMAIFIVIFYDFIENNNYKKYIILTLINSSFHKVALIGLIIPVIKQMYIRIADNKKINIIIILISIFSFLLKGDSILVNILNNIGMNISYETTSPNILAVLLRLVLFAILHICYRIGDKKYISELDKLQLYIYFINTFIFIALSNNPSLSRVTDFISIIEIIILANFISSIKNKVTNVIFTLLIILIFGILFIKDLNANINQGEYYSKDIMSYPYVTIFNKNVIFKYREVMSIYLNI